MYTPGANIHIHLYVVCESGKGSGESSSSAFPSAADQIRRLKYFRNAVRASNGLDPDQDPRSVSPDLDQYRLI